MGPKVGLLNPTETRSVAKILYLSGASCSAPIYRINVANEANVDF